MLVLVEFEMIDGTPIAVNPDKVLFVCPVSPIAENHDGICFMANQAPISLKEDYKTVLEKLRKK